MPENAENENARNARGGEAARGATMAKIREPENEKWCGRHENARTTNECKIGVVPNTSFIEMTNAE